MNVSAASPQPVLEPALAPRRERLVSLDVFRGLTVAGMILVNNPGDWGHLYWPLAHAAWHGLTPTDLVMPFFLFMVGVSIVYAMDSKREAPHGPLMWRIIRRTELLFLIMYLSALFPNLTALNAIRKGTAAAVEAGSSSVWAAVTATAQYYHDRLGSLRLMGVLGRIGVVYFACSLLFLKCSRRTVMKITIGLIVGYYVLLQWVPVNGQWGAATWQPGKDLGAAIDRAVLRPAHLYKSVEGWDPEGLFSSLAAIATGLIGVLAGQTLKRGPGELPARLAGLFSVAVALCLGGWIWSLWFPLNKQLWTSSYTLVTAGLAMLGFLSLYWLTDVKGYKAWTGPGVWFGVNAITAFAGSAILAKAWSMLPLYVAGKQVGLQGWVNANWIRPHVTDPYLASLVWALGFVGLWTIIVWVMYRRGWMLKV